MLKTRILSLVLALSLLSTTAIIGTTASAQAQPPAANGVVLPSTDGLVEITAPAKNQTPAWGRTATQEVDFSALPAQPIPTPQIEVQPGATSLFKTIKPYAIPAVQVVGDTHTFKQDGSATDINAQLAAIGTNVRVYIDTDIASPAKYNAYATFAPISGAEVAAATEIATEFDAMYAAMVAEFGAPALDGFADAVTRSGKINILLFDIDGNGDSSSTAYVAGYFNPNDYFEYKAAADPNPSNYSNEDAVLYVDMGTNHGFANYNAPNGKYKVFSTIAHEFQHMINFSHSLKNSATTQGDTTDPEYQAGYLKTMSLWLNEGLAEYASAFYLDSKSIVDVGDGRITKLLANDFATEVGYVPTTAKWKAITDSSNLLSNYGSSAYLTRQLMSYSTDTAKELITYTKALYNGSLENVSNAFSDTTTDFNKYFEVAVLDLAVDTPDTSIAAIQTASKTAFNTKTLANTWATRGTNVATNGLNTLAASTSVDLGGRTYFSELYLADTIGATESTVAITTPATGNIKYYVIMPFNATGVNDRASWDTSAKITAKLNAGVNSVTVGTDNVFAILAVSYDIAGGNETVTYAVAQPTETVKPTVTTVTPTGTDVAIAGNVVVTFDEAMKTTVGNVALNTTDLSAGAWSDSDTVYTVAYTGLDYETAYTVNITAFQDVAGNAMDADSTSTFTTVEETIVPVAPNVSVATLAITTGGTDTFNVTLGADTLAATTATIASDDVAVATVSDATSTGGAITVNAITEGTATITVTFDDTDVTVKTIEVTVTDEPVVPEEYTITLNQATGGTATASTATAETGDTVTLDATLLANYSFTSWSVSPSVTWVTGSATTKSSSFTMPADNVSVTPVYSYTAPTTPPAGGGVTTPSYTPPTDSGTSNNSSRTNYSNRQDTDRSSTSTKTPLASNTTSWIESTGTKALIDAAKKANKTAINTTSSGAKGVKAETFAQLKGFSYQNDTVKDKIVQVRVSIPNPEKITKNLLVSGYVSGDSVKNTTSMINKWYANKTAVVSFDQQGSFGGAVNISAKLNLSNMKTNNLYFYSYDKKTHHITKIEKPAYFIDTNGYLHFTTSIAGDIIVSDGALVLTK